MHITKYFPDTLSTDQKAAIHKIDDFLNSNTNCFLLKGYAGTGKTFLIQGLSKYFRATGRNCFLMAPTGRAAMVISERTKESAMTIHRTIYNLNDIEDDEEAFQIRYKLNVNNDTTNTVYIIDESSMISDMYNENEFIVFGSGFLLKDLFKYVSSPYRNNSKIIFAGDNAQLPPVGMNFSPALDSQYLNNKYGITVEEYELKEVQRQQEMSSILKFATSLRDCIAANTYNRFELEESGDTTLLNTETFKESYLSTMGNDRLDSSIIITHSNKQARNYNDAVREELFPDKKEIQKGDLLINTKNNYNYEIDIYNGQFLRVVEVSDLMEAQRTVRFYKRKREKVEVVFTFRDIVAETNDIKGNKVLIRCKILDNFLKSDFPTLTQNEQQGLYIDFKNRNPGLSTRTKLFVETLKKDVYFNALQVKYGYAVTCHKAQGGEWSNAFVNFQVYMNILSKGFFRWAYTAVTRARIHLFALNMKLHSPLSAYIVQPVTKISTAPSNQFYVPTEFLETETEIEFPIAFLKAKYIEITEKLKLQDIAFTVDHLQYVERYYFSRDESSATIDLYYGASGFTGSNKIIKTSDQEFADFVNQKISEPLPFSKEYNPEKPFQKELFELILEVTEAEGVNIMNIVNNQYSDRYFIKTDAKCAYIDCVYNSLGIYTAFKPHSTNGDNDTKLQLILNHLK